MVEFFELKEATRIVWQQYPANLNTTFYCVLFVQKKFQKSFKVNFVNMLD